MQKPVIESLDRLITAGGGSTFHKREEISDIDALLDGEYLTEEVNPPRRCLRSDCNERCHVTRADGQFTVECDEGHIESLPVEERTNYKIAYDTVLSDIAESVDLTFTDYDQRELPRYVQASTAEGVNIYLVVAPGDYKKAIHEICIDSLEDDTPALLITPSRDVSDVLDIQSLFSAGNLIYTVPFTELSESGLIRNQLQTMTQIQDFERDVVATRFGDDPNPLVSRVNSNPRYILTELNHMKLLRKHGELKPGKGTRLEKLGESAFSHLFPTLPERGGEDDVAEILPDNLFYIPQLVDDQDTYEPVLGIVDTKSGTDANFAQESVSGKHDEYLKRGRRASVPADCLAHIFLVLGIDGHQDIKFYDKMSEHYRENEYMIVLMADAFMAIMAAYLSNVVANELRLSKGDFRKTIYPFFHKETFNESELSDIIRNVGKDTGEYEREYLKRPGLMVITKETVRNQLQQELADEGDIERILESYY